MTRALVLGGGGPVGIAWETGLVAGLAESGVDVSTADFIMGTSAGSAVGAQLAMGRTPAAMYAAVQAQAASPSLARGVPPAGPAPTLTPLMELMAKAADGQIAPEALRKQIGAFALSAETMPEEAFIATFGRMLASAETWPGRPYACTAVEAAEGTFVLWNNESRVPLSRAVASSCSVPGIFPPITINGRRYMDGGMRSATNADCATGYDHVLVVAVTSNVQGPMAETSRARLARELEALRASGSRVDLIQPDDASREAFGLNLMDASRRGPALDAGLAQGRSAAASLSANWR